MESNSTNDLAFVQKLLNLPKVTSYLSVRDLPEVVMKYVHAGSFKTLDYGCGLGRTTPLLRSLGLDVDSVDINEHVIEISKILDPDGRYKVINSAEIPTEDEYYDFVYVGLVFPYVSTKQELLKITKEIFRVLKPGGIFITSATNDNTYQREWFGFNVDYKQNKNVISGSSVQMDFKQKDSTFVQYYWSENDHQELIKNAGLHLIHIHEPLGNDSDGYAWRDEKEVPPFSIMVAKKNK